MSPFMGCNVPVYGMLGESNVPVYGMHFLKRPRLWDAFAPNVPVYGMKFAKCPRLWEEVWNAEKKPRESIMKQCIK